MSKTLECCPLNRDFRVSWRSGNDVEGADLMPSKNIFNCNLMSNIGANDHGKKIGGVMAVRARRHVVLSVRALRVVVVAQ
eukprot:4549418-Pyramimonas_sp.AAC.1